MLKIKDLRLLIVSELNELTLGTRLMTIPQPDHTYPLLT